MKCPKCGCEGAKISEYKKESVVHKCDNNLLEVGKIFKGEIYSSNPKHFKSENFIIEKIEDPYLYILSLAKDHLKDSEIDNLLYPSYFSIWKNDNLQYLIFLENKKLSMSRYFFGYKGTIPSDEHHKEIVDSLKFFEYIKS